MTLSQTILSRLRLRRRNRDAKTSVNAINATQSINPMKAHATGFLDLPIEL